MIVDEARVINVSHENITDSEATTNAPLSTGDPDITSRGEKDSPVIIAALHECSVCHEQFKTKPVLANTFVTSFSGKRTAHPDSESWHRA